MKSKIFYLFIFSQLFYIKSEEIIAENNTKQILNLEEIIDIEYGLITNTKNNISIDTNEKKEWLIFFYIAADNSLADCSLRELAKIREGAGSNAHIAISYHTRRNGTKSSERLIAKDKKLYLQNQGLHSAKDSGDALVFKNELEWALNFNSKKIMLIVWNHGSGIINRSLSNNLRGICYDNTTGSFLTDIDLKNMIEITYLNTNRKPEIIILDACLMSSLEIAYALKNSANYLIASQDVIPCNSFNYEKQLEVFEKSNISAAEYAKSFVRDFYNNFNYYVDNISVFAFDLTKIEDLNKYINLISKELAELLDSNKEAYSILRDSLIFTLKFKNPDYIDLGDFYNRLYRNIAGAPNITVDTKKKIINLIFEALKKLSKATIASAVSLPFKNATGLSIYFPTKQSYSSSYETCYWAYNNESWLELIKKYIKGKI